jgi:hypothetical protein
VIGDLRFFIFSRQIGTADARRFSSDASAFIGGFTPSWPPGGPSEQLHTAETNSKSEARNPKQCQMSQIENSKRASLQAVYLRDLEISILNLFRISKFELRISKGKLDLFVNFVVTKKT